MPASTPRFENLSHLLATQAAERAEAPALRYRGKTVSYARLARRTERTAARLAHAWGVQAGDRVAYLGWNHVDQITLLFALARLGAVLAPLNTRLATPEWSAIVRDCSPCLLLHDDAFAQPATALAAQHGVAAHSIEELCASPVDSDAPERAAGSAPVLLVYTSGTTGTARGALHTQANLLANMAIASESIALVATDLIATVLPLFHVGGLCIQTLPALYAGAQVLLQPRFDAAAWLQCVEQERPTLSLMVPATMKAVTEHPQWQHTDLSSLRALWAGSSILPRALVEAFHARGVPLCNVYGATETGPFSIALPPAHARTHVGSCGWPASGVECLLASPNADGVGELWIRAPNVARRYWPDVPAVDAEGWFHTGDLALCAADGSYSVVGRAKDMVISGGENIYPAEIENLLSAHPSVQECAVLGLPDAQWGEVVAAAVVLHSGATWQPQALQDFLSPQLARYKLPRRFMQCTELPKTALGKVQRAVLQARLNARGEGDF
jgi:fatty-acyl-CoA synthase